MTKKYAHVTSRLAKAVEHVSRALWDAPDVDDDDEFAEDAENDDIEDCK